MCAIARVRTLPPAMTFPTQCYFGVWYSMSQHIPTLHLPMFGLPYTTTNWAGVNPRDRSFGQSWGCLSLQAQPDPCSETLRGQCCTELSPLWCWGEMCFPELSMLTHSHPCKEPFLQGHLLQPAGCWKPPRVWDEASSV